MTTIYYKTWPVAHLAHQDGLSLTYDAAWEQRVSALWLSFTMPLRCHAGLQLLLKTCVGCPGMAAKD